MGNFWIVALPRKDIEHCIQIGKFGLSRSNIIKRVETGDGIVCCASKEWRVLALGEITKGYYLDDSDVFLRKGPFIDRFDFQARTLGKGKEIEFRPLIKSMKFIKKPEHWQVDFQSGISKMTPEDWQKICDEVSKNEEVS